MNPARNLIILFIIILIPAVNAYTIADYPAMFFEGDTLSAAIIKGSERGSAEITAQNLIVNDLPKSGRKQRSDLPASYYRYRSENAPPTIMTDKQALPGDEIVIGTPCGNSRVRELLNIPTSKCKTHFSQQGMIILIEDENKHLIITGSDGGRVLDAAKILTNPRYRMQLRTKQAPIRRVLYRTSYQINGGEVLDIGQTIGAVTPAISSSYPYRRTEYYPQDGYSYTGSNYGAVVTLNTGGRQKGYIRLPDGTMVYAT